MSSKRSMPKRSESLLDRETAFLITADQAKQFYDHSHRLHEQLLQEVSTRYDYDIFKRPGVDAKDDRLTATSRQVVIEDRKLRDKVGGPTIRRTKFHPSYWKTWNEERDLLEEISRQELIKKLQASKANTPSVVIREKDVRSPPKADATTWFQPVDQSQPTGEAEYNDSKEDVGDKIFLTTEPGNDEIQNEEDPNLAIDDALERLLAASPNSKIASRMKIPTLPTVDKKIKKNKSMTALANVGAKTFDGVKRFEEQERSSYFDLHTTNQITVHQLMKYTRASIEAKFKEEAEKKAKEEKKILGIKEATTPANRAAITGTANANPPDAHPLSIGKAFIKGGGLSRADRAEKEPEKLVTSKCDIPPIPSHVKYRDSHDVKGGTFPSDSRFKDPSVKFVPKGGEDFPTVDADAAKKNDSGFTFPHAKRFPYSSKPSTADGEKKTSDENAAEAAHATPGPGAYTVTRLFDDPPSFLPGKSKNLAEICERYGTDPKAGLLGLTPADFTAYILYCQGCNEDDHIKYGMCQNPKCGYRSVFEEPIIRKNDLRRLAGYEHVDAIGKNKDNIEGEILYGKALAALLPHANFRMTALYTAAFKNDVETIEKLGVMGKGVNPNVQQEETGFTALHIATGRKNTEAVYAIVNSFRGKIDFQRKDYIRGETALHIASRKGYVEITSIICQEEDCDPLAIRNKRGELAIDIVANHQVFQYIKACQDRNDLLRQLAELKGSTVSSGVSSRNASRPVSSKGSSR